MARKRHSSFKLRWSRYYQILVEGQIFYLKLKAYTNRNEGMKEWELITEQTYKVAIKKGNQDNVIVLEEEIAITPTQAITLALNEMYQADEDDLRKAIIEGQNSIRELRRHKGIPEGLEYRLFKRIVELELKEIQEKYKEAM